MLVLIDEIKKMKINYSIQSSLYKAVEKKSVPLDHFLSEPLKCNAIDSYHVLSIFFLTDQDSSGPLIYRFLLIVCSFFTPSGIAASVCQSASFVCAYTVSGELFYWCKNFTPLTDKSIPTSFPTFSKKVSKVACGTDHVSILTTDGQVY